MAYGPMGSMQDIFRIRNGPQMDTPINSAAQNFINPMSAGMKTPQFNGSMSPMSGAVPSPGFGNPFMDMLMKMQGGGGAATVGNMGGMMSPLMGPAGRPPGGAASQNPYNQMMDDNFWTYLLRQMFPQKK